MTNQRALTYLGKHHVNTSNAAETNEENALVRIVWIQRIEGGDEVAHNR
jgi:hypothetical protein